MAVGASKSAAGPDPRACARAYAGRSVLVTGGASFIGSHLVEQLVEFGADVVVVDDFSSGKREYLASLGDDRIVELDLTDRVATLAELPRCELAFHLAAVHGGRGFIEGFPDRILVNLAIDNAVYDACRLAGTRRVVYASSACVYPTVLQASEAACPMLAEHQAGFDRPGDAFAEGAYGWCKLMGEFQLEQIARSAGFTSAAARIFSVYGERENETHAVIALIAKALLRLDPFPVWGTGSQVRNFTYVDDTVTGLLLLGALDDAVPFRAVNVGSSSYCTIVELLDLLFELVGWRPEEIESEPWRAVGVASRASDNTLIRSLSGWEPSTTLEAGLRRTLEWYAERQDRPPSKEKLEPLLLTR
jgi:nucleoside-diphosphate-sugar epimerase